MRAWLTGLRQLARDKADTLLLLAAVALVLAPHSLHLPLWITGTAAATLLWRAVLTVRGLRLPPVWALLLPALAAMGGVYAQYHSFLGRDTGVAMLVLLLAFKTLEMHARRDLFVVLYLSMFVLLTHFFYSQSLASGLLMGLTLWLLVAAQLSFQYGPGTPPLARRLLLAARMLGLALPLALALFVLFPRIQGPLWGRPGEAGASSGLSDSMSPGRIASLAQSDDVAFRVRFRDPAPAPLQLYWRGIVLGDYDGNTWRRLGESQPFANTVNIEVGGAPVRYQITLEPSQTRWLFTLDVPEALPRLAELATQISPELEVSAVAPLQQRVRYAATSYLAYTLQGDESLPHLAHWLVLPPGRNPAAYNLGRMLARLPQPAARADALLRMFNREGFRYTLEPPLLGRDAVDEFLFTTKAGFCEHFAGAFVYVMRAAGLPARVVLGYQGGELNPLDGYYTVRQSDAHAWAEVWLGARGWVRIDPTAAVAPERVQYGARRALPRRAPLGIQALAGVVDFALSGDSWLGRLRYQWQALNNGWNQWVLNYTPERQRAVLDGLALALLNGRSLAGLALAAGLLWLLHYQRRRQAVDPAARLYAELCQRLARRGIVRAPDEAPRTLAARVQAWDGPPAMVAAATAFLHLYSDLLYQPDVARAPALARLARLLQECR
ncbi:DUF3488 and transglutaminase-like domain-containing protein [Massilia sp. TS11]|uniref:transglutaminase TgpA family protein n=1 Tax=Massilia sp. TS11 TaxID=2908003 RepID=UPI001EDB2A19|nr:DUF3488 and transglutaminase-like domain-containing protein [Massilia sp. TS11]MCG2585572.1 DUF3488 and transglutaminase-like domain-containing protein [Massilia sp. TS11]